MMPRLTIARLSRRNRRSESCKGVGDFFSWLAPGGGAIVTVASIRQIRYFRIWLDSIVLPEA